jgi:hypothetical protein
MGICVLNHLAQNEGEWQVNGSYGSIKYKEFLD